MKHWVIGDIHGQYYALRALLDNIDVENDCITFLGDYVDWGNYSIETLLFLIKLTKKHKNINCLIGNHDKMMLKSIKNKFSNKLTALGLSNWGKNGGKKTIKKFNKLDEEDKEAIIEWLEKLSYSNEAEVNGKIYYLAHAYPFVNRGNRQKAMNDVIWKRVKKGENPFALMEADYNDAKLICGHTISRHFTHGSFDVFFDNRYIILDCGAKVLEYYPKKAKIAAICLEDLKVMYIDCVDADNWRWNNLSEAL